MKTMCELKSILVLLVHFNQRLNYAAFYKSKKKIHTCYTQGQF